MFTFREYYSLIQEDITLASIAQGHVSTHTKTKRAVISKEHNFFQIADVAFDSNSKVIGVVGNFDGWFAHEAEYAELGFAPDNMLICEMGKKEFDSLLYGYLTEIAKVDIKPGKYSIGDIIKSIRPTGIQYGYNKGRTEIVYVKYPGHAALLRGEIKPGEISTKRGYDIITGLNVPKGGISLNDLIRTFINNVSYLDFDVTTGIKTPENIIDMNTAFYQSFNNLQACVQVHAAQRTVGVDDPTALQAAKDFANQYEQFDYLTDREISAIQAVHDIVEGGAPRIDRITDRIARGLANSGRASYVQIYPGASEKTMVSIATARDGGVSMGVDSEFVETEFGSTDLENAQRALKKIEKTIGRDNNYYIELETILRNF